MRLGAEVIDLLNYQLVILISVLWANWEHVLRNPKIRNFLTEALTTIIDAAFSVIYIAVMSFYSWLLTLVALLVVPIGPSHIVGAPLFENSSMAAEENASTQSLDGGSYWYPNS